MIAIASPFKHRKIYNITCCPQHNNHVMVISCVTLGSCGIFWGNGYIKVASYGICVLTEITFITSVITYFIPIMIPSMLTLILNIYLTIKAYQIRKEVQKESSLLGGSNSQVQSLQQKHANIRKHMKPVITLLVIILGSVFIGFFFVVRDPPIMLIILPIMLCCTAQNFSYYA